MRKSFNLAILLVAGGLISTAAWACGDKLMLTIGNVRFRQMNGSPRPASILAYTPRNSTVAQVVRDLQRQSAGDRAGLRFYSLDDRARLDEVLRAQKYDLLLVDAGDADNLEREAESLPSKPLVLPVVDHSSKAAAAEAKKKFHCILTAPNSPGSYLLAIDRAMDLKLKTRSQSRLP